MTAVIARIKDFSPGSVVTPKDFMDLASRDAVDQTLSRLTRQGLLQRIARGLYYIPKTNDRLGIRVPPDIDQVAQAAGRQTGSRVMPTPAMIANRLGLSTQVPAKPVYLTDGRSRSIRVGNRTIRFKHVAAKRLSDRDDRAGQALQALRAAGPDARHSFVAALRDSLDETERKQLLNEARYSDEWVAEAAKRIAMPVA